MAGAPRQQPANGTPTTQPASQATPKSSTRSGGETPESWLTQLPPELQKEKSLSRYKDLQSLVKGHLELEKFTGNALRVPGENATPEEREAFYAKLGRPESPDKYDIKFAEGTPIDEKLVGSFRTEAHKLGLTQAQAQAIAEWYGGQAGGIMEAQGAQREAQVAEWQKQLQTEWGWKAEGNQKIAARTLASIVDGNQEHPIVKLLDETGLGNHPAMIRFFYDLGLQRGEDKLIMEDTAPTADDRVSAQDRINEIRGDKEHPYNNARHPSHKAAVAEMQRLYEVLTAPES